MSDQSNEITVLVEEGKAVHVVYLNITKAFNTVPCNVLMDKLTK